MAATLNIVDVRRVAAAIGATDARVVKATDELGLTLHSINGRPYIDVADEDRVRQHCKTTGMASDAHCPAAHTGAGGGVDFLATRPAKTAHEPHAYARRPGSTKNPPE